MIDRRKKQPCQPVVSIEVRKERTEYRYKQILLHITCILLKFLLSNPVM